MQKIITWIGGVALLSLAVVSILLTEAGAEVGDQIYVHRAFTDEDPLVLDASQKAKLRAAVVAKWPAVAGHEAQITEHYCMRDCEDLVTGVECTAVCEVCWESSASATDYLALRNTGKIRQRTSDVDDPVDFVRCSARTETTGAALASLVEYVESLGDLDISTSIDLRSKRSGTDITAAYNDIRVASPAAYVALERQGLVGRDLGVVAE